MDTLKTAWRLGTIPPKLLMYATAVLLSHKSLKKQLREWTKHFTPKRTTESSSQFVCIACSSEGHTPLLETPSQTTPQPEWDASVVIVIAVDCFVILLHYVTGCLKQTIVNYQSGKLGQINNWIIVSITATQIFKFTDLKIMVVKPCWFKGGKRGNDQSNNMRYFTNRKLRLLPQGQCLLFKLS